MQLHVKGQSLLIADMWCGLLACSRGCFTSWSRSFQSAKSNYPLATFPPPLLPQVTLTLLPLLIADVVWLASMF